MEKTLLIMAAGLGSRFGGLKQLEPIGPNGEFIIDYSIYDAVRFGFTKVILVIKEENYELFHKTIGSRIEKKIKVEYVFQKNTDVPVNSELTLDREKPLGTAHVIYSARNAITEPFGLINADDFYGYDAFKNLSEFLDNKCTSDIYGLIAYSARNTLSESGSVKRGVITSLNDFLIKLNESSINKVGDNLRVESVESNIISIYEDDVLVSMNMFCFHNNIADYSHDEMMRFMDKSNYSHDKESFMPDLITNLINEGKIKVLVGSTSSKWFGVTYKDDLANVKSSIQTLIYAGVYPNNLWD